MAAGFIQVQPDSTGKLVDTTIVTTAAGVGQHRENVVIGDPFTFAAVAQVARTPNADLMTPSQVASYAQLSAGTDGLLGRVFAADSEGRMIVAASGELMENILTELRNHTNLLRALFEPGAPRDEFFVSQGTEL